MTDAVMEEIIDLINKHPKEPPEVLVKRTSLELSIFKMRLMLLPAYMEKQSELKTEE